MRKILLRCADWCVFLYTVCTVCVCACVCLMTVCYFFLNLDKAGVSAACYALALLHRIHTHTHTGDNQPFPLPQHDIVCMCMGLCVCKWRFLSMWQMGSHSSSSHGGGRKSLLDATTFIPPKNFWEVGGRGIPVELDRLKICASALAGCAWVLEHQTVPNEAKAGQSKPSFRRKACAENSFFNIM